MIIQKLSSLHSFSDSEREVAKYILENRNNICKMSIHELAKNTYSSSSTILRLCKKIGFHGFADFKISFNSELSKNVDSSTIDNLDFPFSQEDSYENIIDNIFKLYTTSIADAIDKFNLQQMEVITKHLLSSSIIDIYGQGSSQASAYEFKSKMLRLGKIIHLESSYIEQMHQAINSNSSHYAIVISHSGNSPETLKVTKILKNNNIRILAITNNKDTILAKVAEDKIFTSITEATSLIGKIETFGSSIATQFILDCLYSFVFHSNYRKNLIHTKSNEDKLRSKIVES